MEEKLNVAILQNDLIWEDAERNKEEFQQNIEKCSSDVDLIVLPEMFSTGFSMNAQEFAEPENGLSVKWMQKMATENDVAVTGSLIISENEKFYNRLFFVFPDGTYQKYDKRHTFTLAKEHETYVSGKEKLIVTYKGWKICPLVCYDLRFPVWARNAEEYDVLIFVANWPEPRMNAWDVLLKARAIENLCYCVGVNRVGVDGNGHNYVGHSAVYDPMGQQLSTPEWEQEFQQEISLYKSEVKNTREKFRFLQDRDTFKVI